MKILVLSDSHNILYSLDKVIESLKDSIKAVLHLGDCSSDMKRYPIKYPDIDFYSINGNCDFNADVPSEILISAGGKNIFMTHGHTYNVKGSYDRISYIAKEKKADICLFGHTHLPTLFIKEHIYFMNPGSISFPRGIKEASYGIIDIFENGDVNMSIVAIYKSYNKVILNI